MIFVFSVVLLLCSAHYIWWKVNGTLEFDHPASILECFLCEHLKSTLHSYTDVFEKMGLTVAQGVFESTG